MPLGGRRSSVTTRAIALAVVFLVLTISYASSLRIYVTQTSDIAAAQQEIADRQARIAVLQSNLSRWDDPAYVQAQARARLGWVLPGETGYRVVGEDGMPIGGPVQITPSGPTVQTQAAWWDTLWGSMEAADDPAPEPTGKPARQPTITESTRPSSSPQPR